MPKTEEKQNTHGNNRNTDKDLWICTSERTQRITASLRCCSYIWRTHRRRLAAESSLAALIPLCWCWHRAVIPSQESPIFELFTPTPLHGLMGSLTARQERHFLPLLDWIQRRNDRIGQHPQSKYYFTDAQIHIYVDALMTASILRKEPKGEKRPQNVGLYSLNQKAGNTKSNKQQKLKEESTRKGSMLRYRLEHLNTDKCWADNHKWGEKNKSRKWNCN